MKICSSCGKAMDDNYSVCPYCGVMVNDAAQAGNGQNYAYGQGGAPAGGYQAPAANGQAPEYTPAPKPQKSAYVAAFLALLFGVYGLHDFYLDRKNKGLVKLLVSLLGCGVGIIVIQIISIIDAIKILKGEINTDGNGDLIKMGL